MPLSNGGGKGNGRPPLLPELEELLKRSQDKLKQVMPGGAGLPGSLMFQITVAIAAIIAFYAFTFRVDPDELGVVMLFGKPVRTEPPGLHFRLPYPIDEVRLPKVTRQNIIEIGMRSSGAARSVQPVLEESLVLTGDENIIDINFVVFWRIKDAQKYLFNIQNPDVTVKEVAESAMRDIVGRSNIQPLLTGARQETEQAVQKLTQGVLDSYGVGVSIDQVQLQKVDPPTQVIAMMRAVATNTVHSWAPLSQRRL
jgi:modulator of FtsH protease HflK